MLSVMVGCSLFNGHGGCIAQFAFFESAAKLRHANHMRLNGQGPNMATLCLSIGRQLPHAPVDEPKYC